LVLKEKEVVSVNFQFQISQLLPSIWKALSNCLGHSVSFLFSCIFFIVVSEPEYVIILMLVLMFPINTKIFHFMSLYIHVPINFSIAHKFFGSNSRMAKILISVEKYRIVGLNLHPNTSNVTVTINRIVLM